jgi:riboflavin kinase/FMN adenylyltransferase
MAALAVQHGEGRLPPGTAACLGAFDGFHLGHQALLRTARSLAPQVAVVTFDPHPAAVLDPRGAPTLLCGPRQRVRVLEHLGVERLVLLPFSRELASLSPDAFIQRYLLDGLAPAAVVVGDDFRFGHRRTGDVALLGQRLEAARIPFQAISQVPPPAGSGADSLGSRVIRQALARGEVEAVAVMLGRLYSVAGTVARGARRGRDLGYPTANVQVSGGCLPEPGIYATTFTVWDERSPHHGAVWPAATSLGRNPTFVKEANAPLVLESHVLDLDPATDLYDLEVEVSFVSRLRGELSFDDVNALVRQIDRDVEATRRVVDTAALERTLRPIP